MNNRKIIIAGIILLGILFSAVTQGQAAEDRLVQHSPVLCAARETPFELRFRVISDVRIEEARVYFRIKDTKNFYFTLARQQEDGEFIAILPGAKTEVSVIEYILMLIEEGQRAVKSSPFMLAVDDQQACNENHMTKMPDELIISSDEAIDPEIGFSGEYIIWDLPEENNSESAYLDGVAEQMQVLDMLSDASVDDAEDADTEDPAVSSSGSKTWSMNKKTLIIAGTAGAGAIALAGAIASGAGGSDGGIWSSVGETTDQAVAVLYKTPAEQSACGTVVTNQLFLTNNASEELRLGIVDYEVILTKDSPAGSCRPGRSGSFAPSSKTILAPGENVLLREWRNDVNPCSGCPYLSAECVWESRYIVHTSLGSAVAMSNFSAQGNLCTPSTAKGQTPEHGQQLCGDDVP
ncbi:hypothetical protein CSB45_08500 [candidate division KSB3 bacterium]|uniref:Uncharacterized protein n=1 Tax=candidate division KSB3 bacterium TaxID=2044937 RepID=A0A2G6E5A6_9BACT|nr:MAG: hypothetical protein CSB45_08500 [candidate division KSB3 bacterium]PIE29742.1 MAG: hypothetical protein CSA57_06715 [candidate division KSB3 bacterium]